MKLVYIVAFIVCSLARLGVSETPETDTQRSDQQSGASTMWPVGDARRCQMQIKDSQLSAKRFEVMPGLGWDNLRNLEASQVVSYNYSLCRTTDDGKFLIPDNVFTIPLKSSSVETYAEMITHWTTSTSTTANSINVNAGLNTVKYSISGSFSRENRKLKAKQIEDNSVTVRVQMRYNRYEAKLQPDSDLSPQFKNRVRKIAAHVMLNETRMAYYKAQLLVRDFGTHVLTSVTAGAALVKDDYIKRSFVEDRRDDKTKILASASGSFVKMFNVGGSFNHEEDKTIDTMYRGNTTHSFIQSQGGYMIVAGETDGSHWAAGVERNMVTMDRAGDPLYFYITHQAFPDVPPGIVSHVEKIIRQAIQLYYSVNAIPGCTKLGSPNFSMSANFDDGSCEAEYTNKTFGGMYQVCTVQGTYVNQDPCSGLDQVNPKTGKHSCPADYTPVLLHSGTHRGVDETTRHCSRCKLFFKCCHTTLHRSTATYKAYWCAATGKVAENSGYLFGGLFTSSVPNPVTGSRDCPNKFYPRRLFTDMTVCISDDFEMDAGFSLPFGGFYSCTVGNPLVFSSDSADGNLRSFLNSQHDGTTDDVWPQRCPAGYSAHLAEDDMGCSVHYCVGAGALSGPSLPPIKLPPYMLKPTSAVDNENNLVVLDSDSGTWMRGAKAYKFQSLHEQNKAVLSDGSKDASEGGDGNGGQERTLSPGIAAVVGAMVALAAVALVAGALVGCRRISTNLKTARQNSAREATTEGHVNQGQTNDEGVASSSMSERI